MRVPWELNFWLSLWPFSSRSFLKPLRSLSLKFSTGNGPQKPPWKWKNRIRRRDRKLPGTAGASAGPPAAGRRWWRWSASSSWSWSWLSPSSNPSAQWPPSTPSAWRTLQFPSTCSGSGWKSTWPWMWGSPLRTPTRWASATRTAPRCWTTGASWSGRLRSPRTRYPLERRSPWAWRSRCWPIVSCRTRTYTRTSSPARCHSALTRRSLVRLRRWKFFGFTWSPRLPVTWLCLSRIELSGISTVSTRQSCSFPSSCLLWWESLFSCVKYEFHGWIDHTEL